MTSRESNLIHYGYEFNSQPSYQHTKEKFGNHNCSQIYLRQKEIEKWFFPHIKMLKELFMPTDVFQN